MNRNKLLLLLLMPLITVVAMGQGPQLARLGYVNLGGGWQPWSAIGSGGPPGYPLESILLYCQNGSTIAPCAPPSSGGPASFTNVSTQTGGVSQTWPVGAGGVTAHQLVIYDDAGGVIDATDASQYAGIAASTAASGTVEVFNEGFASCVFDGPASPGDIAVPSSTNPGQCDDSGNTTPYAVGVFTPLVGIIQSNVVNPGDVGKVFLFSQSIFGLFANDLNVPGTLSVGTSGGQIKITGVTTDNLQLLSHTNADTVNLRTHKVTTGEVDLAADPTTALQAGTKQYIDGRSGVTSFKARTGAILAVSGDYTAAQVTNAFDTSNAGMQSIAGGITSALGGFSSTNGDISIFGGHSLLTSNIKDTSGGLAATIAAGKFTFPGLATFTLGLTVPVGQSVNTPIIRDNAGNAAATLSAGAFTFPQVGTFTLGAKIGTGQTMTAPPEMVAYSGGGMALATLNNLSGAPLTMISPITITRLEWQLNATATGCTVQPQVTVMVNSVASALVATVNLASFFGHQDTNVNVPAGQNVQLKVTTASAGCTPTTSTFQGQVHYLMQ